MEHRRLFPIQVVIIGGGIAGLTAAIAFSRVGHRVVVLEQDADLNVANTICGGCRLAPNMASVFKRWGLEPRLRQIGVLMDHAEFPGFQSGQAAAGGDWADDMTVEAGAKHFGMRYEDFRRLLADTARASGVIIRPNSRAVSTSVKPDSATVKLVSGELVAGDLVVAADGLNEVEGKLPISRPMMLGDREYSTYKKLMLYNALIPASAMRIDHGAVYSWYGDSYGAIGFPTRLDEFCLHIYIPTPHPSEDKITVTGPEELVKVVTAGKAEPRLQKLAAAAHTVVGIPLKDRPSLEDWAHPDGPMIVIGEAAHPLTSGSLSALNLAVGDGVFLGRLFKNLHRKQQIGAFLGALVENRQKRIADVQKSERLNPTIMSLPAGVEQARYLKTTVQHMSDEGAVTFGEEAIRNTFAYDPEDEADSWWEEWGLLQERAAKITPITPLNLNSELHARIQSIS
ncbi:uncharacterized protein B0H18DRAFT_1012208 [Fomitopsis serialis]|uniref:uncharacterized protein n=1 Tax=Fomitopsis serialis TaxID=139415 RepID=UPI002007D7AC|nr:uncharacterized protein B0H18DRAFT_1012208 [Neoantrodia serialis]KAH9924442.1 hypothetical protein B0H18DRAFT_1012208 [Neoantrodia serialis]